MIVQSFGSLQAYGDPPRPTSSPDPWSSSLIAGDAQTYATIYRTQPNVRTVVDFLARNIASLEVHAFRRVSDNDRERLADHEVISWLEKPNPATTRYRLFEGLMQDLGIYMNAVLMKIRRPDGRIGLVRLPPETVTVEGWLLPSAYVWMTPDGMRHPLDPSEVVSFSGYDPNNPLVGLSILETLRQILAADSNATEYQEQYYRNAARIEAVIERPATAPKWSKEQKDSFREQWQSRYAGPGNVGATPVLEDGMSLKTMSHSPRDSEFVASRKLTAEEVARAFHVPLPMVGILDHATFSNIKEQHKQLYQDCLSPWLKFLHEELERQLLIEAKDQDRVYLEFNINEKLKGDFEEQAASLQKLVGRPIMTANEGRARLNLSSIKDDPSADELALQLNTSTGSARSFHPNEPEEPEDEDEDEDFEDPSTNATAAIIRREWMRQRARLEKVDRSSRAESFEVSRWDRELAEALEPVYLAVGLPGGDAARRSLSLASTVNHDTLELLVRGEDAFGSVRDAGLYR